MRGIATLIALSIVVLCGCTQPTGPVIENLKAVPSKFKNTNARFTETFVEPVTVYAMVNENGKNGNSYAQDSFEVECEPRSICEKQLLDWQYFSKE